MHSGRNRPSLSGAGTVLSVLLLAGCEHSQPFTPPDAGTGGPLRDTEPTRLTYSQSSGSPAWTPDGEALVFPFVDQSRPDDDVCLALLPAEGGTISRLICHQGPLTSDTTDRLELPALASDSRLAFIRSSRPVGSVNDRERWLVAAPWDDPADERLLRFVPFQSSTGTQLSSVGDIRWLDDQRLIILANAQTITGVCPTCRVESGREIVLVDLAGGGIQFTELPVTGNPSSIATDGGDLYYTVAGENAVYRVRGGAGTPVVVHTFATRNAIREIDVAAGTLAAVTDGFGSVVVDTPDGTILEGGPGELVLVDLATGAEQEIATGDLLFNAPALAPDADAVAVVAVPYVTVAGAISIVGGPDIWRFRLQ